ncbi:hypothetical protein ABTU71_19105, partial [Acinetobacter baumannii]
NVSFRQFLGNGWKLNTVASVSYNKDKIINEVQNQQNQKIGTTGINSIDYNAFNLNTSNWMWQLRAVFDKKFGSINTFRFG